MVVTLLAVVFLLPRFVDHGGGATIVDEQQPEEQLAVPDDASPQVSPEEAGSRELADQALADVLEITDRLQAKGVEVWGGGRLAGRADCRGQRR